MCYAHICHDRLYPTWKLHSKTCKDAIGSPLKYTKLKVVELKVSLDDNIYELIHKKCN